MSECFLGYMNFGYGMMCKIILKCADFVNYIEK